MVCEIKVLRKNRCETFREYRKDLKQCITAAQNYILKLSDKSINEVIVTIYRFGKKVYGWKYKPTLR